MALGLEDGEKRKKSDEYATESEQSAHTQALVLIAPPISLYGCSLHIYHPAEPEHQEKKKISSDESAVLFSPPPSLFF